MSADDKASDPPFAYVDPAAFAMVAAVERVNLYRSDPDAIRRLVARAEEKGPGWAVIVIDVDVGMWQPLVDMLMPGHDWDVYRKAGAKPVARGVVPRSMLADLLQAGTAANVFSASDAEFNITQGSDPYVAVFGIGGISVFEGER